VVVFARSGVGISISYAGRRIQRTDLGSRRYQTVSAVVVMDYRAASPARGV
jgi:hypothetical protein